MTAARIVAKNLAFGFSLLIAFTLIWIGVCIWFDIKCIISNPDDNKWGIGLVSVGSASLILLYLLAASKNQWIPFRKKIKTE